jgi:hypothetical protein
MSWMERPGSDFNLDSSVAKGAAGIPLFTRTLSGYRYRSNALITF